MWAFCMTSRCWFCLVPHEEYLSLVCEQKATKQVEFIRLMAEILHHFWLDGISLHPLNLNIGGIQMQETDAVMNGWNPAPPSMSSQHWNYGGCRGKHQRCYNAIHGRRCRISAINSSTKNYQIHKLSVYQHVNIILDHISLHLMFIFVRTLPWNNLWGNRLWFGRRYRSFIGTSHLHQGGTLVAFEFQSDAFFFSWWKSVLFLWLTFCIKTVHVFFFLVGFWCCKKIFVSVTK